MGQGGDDIFVNEDLNKVENRINLSLFGLLPAHAFRSWFLDRLRLPEDAVLYPSTNVVGHGGSIRPDFVIKHGDGEVTLGWLEVECTRDQAQLDRFRTELAEPVLAIWGVPDPAADLSLQEIAEALRGLDLSGEHQQILYNVRHLEKLIREHLDGIAARSYKPAAVSPFMLETPFVAGICAALEGRVSFEVFGSMRRGEIRAQTNAERGFSLRVYSRISKSNRSLSVLNQSGGRPEIRFPSREKMYHYLPDRRDAVDKLVALVADMGGDMVDLPKAVMTSVDIRRAKEHISDLVAIVLELAA